MIYEFYTTKGGGNTAYSAPAIEVLDITTEKGFAVTVNYGEEGNAGTDPGDNNYGDY